MSFLNKANTKFAFEMLLDSGYLIFDLVITYRRELSLCCQQLAQTATFHPVCRCMLTGDPLVDAVVAGPATAVAEADDALQCVGVAGGDHQRSATVTL